MPGSCCRMLHEYKFQNNSSTLAALLHIADLRLCTRAQWEFRKVVSLMRKELLTVAPQFAILMQPKCGENVALAILRRISYEALATMPDREKTAA